MIAATDPISVIALLREIGVSGRLRLLIESESLLNDGIAALLFALVLTSLGEQGLAPTPMLVFRETLLIGGGGIGVGVIAGALCILIAGRTDDHLVETALSAVAAYGSFLTAEYFGASGVLATVSAGLLMGNLGVPAESRSQFASFQTGTRLRRGFLGVCRLSRELLRVPVNRTGARRYAGAFAQCACACRRDRPCAPWPRGGGLSGFVVFLALALED